MAEAAHGIAGAGAFEPAQQSVKLDVGGLKYGNGAYGGYV